MTFVNFRKCVNLFHESIQKMFSPVSKQSSTFLQFLIFLKCQKPSQSCSQLVHLKIKHQKEIPEMNRNWRSHHFLGFNQPLYKLGECTLLSSCLPSNPPVVCWFCSGTACCMGISLLKGDCCWTHQRRSAPWRQHNNNPTTTQMRKHVEYI